MKLTIKFRVNPCIVFIILLYGKINLNLSKNRPSNSMSIFYVTFHVKTEMTSYLKYFICEFILPIKQWIFLLVWKLHYS